MLKESEARLVKEISELKRCLEISTDSGAVKTSYLGQPSQDLQSQVLQSDVSVRTTDRFIMYSSIPVISLSTETKTSLATSVVMTPVVSSNNE